MEENNIKFDKLLLILNIEEDELPSDFYTYYQHQINDMLVVRNGDNTYQLIYNP